VSKCILLPQGQGCIVAHVKVHLALRLESSTHAFDVNVAQAQDQPEHAGREHLTSSSGRCPSSPAPARP
jgi:hypothetical protein